ncbi:NAD(P)/FAD-dependent oxidoreductase [Paenibacillus antri]|uniref:NAD(P)/FAD-dependent oxidoreductase n=1 Tax=Paenibacillus antri TaxID=2582848 RepID=A0A5R9G4L3_9BACL|nr:nitrite reductase large subunit NirB [Paenibacillus antri]TLS49276.1 NAD(P)/FAD-dependent oxidoreductase [Paenibacillus antri]
MTNKTKLVLIGNGMAGVQTLEHIIKLAPEKFDVTIFGKEPHPNYNRIQLSYVLEGSKTMEDIILNDYAWYEERGIRLVVGDEVVAIDTERKTVRTAAGLEASYDVAILATGSKPFRLPIPGAELPGVIGFREIADCEAMMDAAKRYRSAAVIGGGLLGLEAARGLQQLGMDVTVVHLMDRLMERQLDAPAAGMLRRELERRGLNVMTGRKTEAVLGEERVAGLRFADGSTLAADLVVMAAGIVPNAELAKASGIETGRGIRVDDFLRTSAEGVYAVGECVEHRGVTYGLVAPLYEQGAVLAKHLCGAETEGYIGSVTSTKLKISGMDVFSAGEFLDAEDTESIVVKDPFKNTYKKVVLRDGRVVGGVLFGDASLSTQLTKWSKAQAALTPEMHGELVGGGGCCGGGAAKGTGVAAMADDDIVCGCAGVTKGTIVGGIREQGWASVEQIKACTNATRSCGGCKPMVEELLKLTLGASYDGAGAAPAGICGCTTMGRDEIVAAIREKRLTHVREAMAVLGWSQPEGCSKCRPALNYYIGMLWPEDADDDDASRFVNERLHANIQKDGTFSVIPRIYGGVTTAKELKKIAEVAEKYEVPMVKFTGGQRLDLLGVKKEDLPAVWAELDMPSGYGYGKSLRTVKTCVGSTFCRFGTQDSMGMGIALEKKFERLNMPAKFKMAVNGCPRNCAESGTKDLGIVGNDGGWEIYVGGNGGIKLRGADLLCKVKTDEELIEISGAFIQYYRETGKYLERTSDWVERIGLDAVRAAVVDDVEGRKALNERVEQALAQLEDPWKRVVDSETLQETLFDKVHS